MEEQKDELVVKDAPQDVKLQKVLVVFADGRQGVFIGPALFSSLEMASPPRLVKVDFSEPFSIKAENGVVAVPTTAIPDKA